MKKTPSLFNRDYEGDRLVFDEVVPGSEWVLRGAGVATRKWDGTSCLRKDGKLWRRLDSKLTKVANKAKRSRTGKVLIAWHAEDFKNPPDGWVAAQEPDLTTGHWPGWVPVGDGPNDAHHIAARDYAGICALVEGKTYELCGPHFQGNPEGFERDTFCEHGDEEYDIPDRSFNSLRTFLKEHEIEGIVFHHPDGQMVKVRRRDFGFSWPIVDSKRSATA